MKRIWFKCLLGVLLAASIGGMAFSSPQQVDASQGQPYQTGVFITVGNAPDGTNVRSGPNSADYGPSIGHLNPGETAPALGKSPGGEWIQIAYPAGPDGKGWVYSFNVVVTGGELQIVEPPPTHTPPVVATLDLTVVAALNPQPTQTRLPTFTPPAPLTVPAFTDSSPAVAPGVFGIFIVSLGLIGGIGLLVSFILRQ